MKEVDITPVSEIEARQITENIKKDFSNLGEKVLEAYRRRVWEPLGYENFTSYTSAEFGLSKHESYSLRLNTLTTLSLLPELGEEAYKIPGNQKELLHKLPSEQRSEGFKEAQQIAKDQGRDKPTAKDVKKVVETKLGKPVRSPGASYSASQSPKVPQENLPENIVELQKQLRHKNRIVEKTVWALHQAQNTIRELRHENLQLQRLLNSLGEPR